jgi:predicted cupin superfamily sugar epimerase
MDQNDLIARIIELFGLEPLPREGGLFRRTYRSDELIPKDALPKRYFRDKAFGTAILYLYTSDPDSFSAMHRLPTDEIYHFYLGDPVEMLLLYPDQSSERVVLGRDIFNGQQVQYVVKRGVWQGSRLIDGGHFALVGTTMAPGFDEEDFYGGERAKLIEGYPSEEIMITKLTRI